MKRLQLQKRRLQSLRTAVHPARVPTHRAAVHLAAVIQAHWAAAHQAAVHQAHRAAVPAAVIQDHQEVIQITVHPTIPEAVHPAVQEAAMHQVHRAAVPVLNHQAVHPDQKVGTTLGQLAA